LLKETKEWKKDKKKKDTRGQAKDEKVTDMEIR
jgi:hypothetical protein